MSENETIGSEVEKNVTMEQFLTAVCTSKSAGEVADKTGLSADSVLTRMSQYRNRGIAVPHFARGGGARLDADKANELIASLLQKDSTEVKATGETLKAAAEKRKAEREAAKAEATAE